MRAACLTRTASELTAAASGSSSPTTTGCPRSQRTTRCTSGARTSAGPTVAQLQPAASLPARPRCVPVQQCETWLIGLVLAAAQGDRLRLHHWRRIRQLRSQNRPVYSLSKITISEVSEVQRSMQQSNNLYTLIPDINSRPTLGNLSPTGRMSRNFMPPADTAALICLSFTNACVVSTIIIFRCGRMAPPHSKRLGLKHVIVHFRNEFTQ